LLIASRDRNPAFADLYTVNHDGGDKKLLIENEGQTLGWLVNLDLMPVILIHSVEGGELAYPRARR
jgi:hypothetical protein